MEKLFTFVLIKKNVTTTNIKRTKNLNLNNA